MDAFVDTFLNVDSFLKVYPLLLDGLLMTIRLIVTIVPLGIAIGLFVAVLGDFNIPFL